MQKYEKALTRQENAGKGLKMFEKTNKQEKGKKQLANVGGGRKMQEKVGTPKQKLGCKPGGR